MNKYELITKTLNFEDTPYMPVGSSWVTEDFLLDVTKESKFTKHNAREIFFKAMKKIDCDLIVQYVLPFPERYDTCKEASLRSTNHKFNDSVICKKGVKFSSPEDVKDYILTLPEPETLEKSFNFEENYFAWTDLMKARDKYMGDMAWIPGHIAKPTDFMLYSYFGYEPYLMALELFKPEMKILFEISGEEMRLRNSAVAKSIVDNKFIDWVYLGEDICGKNGPMCKPETLTEIYWPSVKHSLKPLKDAGIKLLWHSDGNIMPIMENLIDAGIDGLQGFEEETGMDLEILSEIKAKTGKKIAILGSLSVTTTLPFGSTDDVKNKIEYLVNLSKKRGGGIIMGTSSTILKGTPNENIH